LEKGILMRIEIEGKGRAILMIESVEIDVMLKWRDQKLNANIRKQ